MKRFVFIPGILAVAMALFSCGGSEGEKQPFEFSKVEPVVCDSIAVDQILQPMNWTIVGDKAVLSSPKTDSLFYVYRLPGFEYLYNFGVKGNGPYEYIYASVLPDVQGEGRFFAGDRLKILSYGLEDGFVSDIRRISSKGGMNPQAIVRDSIVVSKVMSFKQEGLDYLYVTVDLLNGEVKDTVRALLNDNKVVLTDRGASLGKSMRNVPFAAYRDGGFVLVYPDVRSMRFYRVDTTGKIAEQKIVGSTLTGDQIKQLADTEFLSGYGISNIQGTDKYVYILSYLYDPQKGRTPLETNIEVYDWQGNAVKKLGLDRSFTHFLVDEASGKIFCYDFKKDFEQVYAYPFKI